MKTLLTILCFAHLSNAMDLHDEYFWQPPKNSCDESIQKRSQRKHAYRKEQKKRTHENNLIGNNKKPNDKKDNYTKFCSASALLVMEFQKKIIHLL